MRDPLEAIRVHVDLVELVSDYVRLERSGKNFRGLCPFHAEHTPSFYVSPALGRFHCFGCNASGDAFTFLMRIEGISFQEAVEKLARKAGVALPRPPEAVPSSDLTARLRRALRAAHFYFRQHLKRSEQAQAYLRERGIEEATIEKFGLGYAPDRWDGLVQFFQKHKLSLEDAQRAGLVELGKSNNYYDRFRARLIFPLQDAGGRVIAFGGRLLEPGEPKYLNSPETPLFEKRHFLYGWHLARAAILKRGEVLIVEGYLDLIMLHQHGFDYAVATLGTAFTEEHAQRLKRLVERAYLAYDADEAGVKAALRAAEVLQKEGITPYLLTLPAGQDPDSLLRQKGAGAFQELIAGAQRATLFALQRLASHFDLQTMEGRVAFLQAALPLLAAVPTAVERETYIQWLAPYTLTYLLQPEQALQALREDIRRFMRQQRRRAPTVKKESEQLKAGPTQAQTLVSTAIPRAAWRAETTLLRAACMPEHREYLWPLLNESLFSLPIHRRIVHFLRHQWADAPALTSAELIAHLPEEPLQHALTGILLREEEPISRRTIEDCVAYLKRRQIKARRTELVRALANGAEPDLQEYWQLVIGSKAAKEK